MYAFVNTENILRKLFLELFYAIIYMYTVLYSMCNVQPIFLAPPMVEEFFITRREQGGCLIIF